MLLAFMVGLSFAAVGAVPHVDPDRLRRHARILREALRLADLSLEKASLEMGIAKQQLHNQLAGEGHVSHTRLMLLPDEVWQWLGVVIAESFGLPERIYKAGSLEKAVLARRKQLVMSIQETRQNREAV